VNQAQTNASPLKHWSAITPIGMSLTALLLVLVYGLIIRPGPQEDEGTPAHIYQLLMSVQVPIVAYFAIQWLPRQTRSALVVLGLQGLAWLAALAALYYFEHQLAVI
jgi:hypothetical protein